MSRARRLFRSTPSANPIVYRWLAGGECTAGADRRVHATRLVCLPDTFCELCTIVPQYDGCGTYRPRCLVDVPHLLSSLTRDAFTNLGNSVFSLPSSSSHLRCSSSYLFLFLCFRNIMSPWVFAFGPNAFRVAPLNILRDISLSGLRQRTLGGARGAFSKRSTAPLHWTAPAEWRWR